MKMSTLAFAAAALGLGAMSPAGAALDNRQPGVPSLGLAPAPAAIAARPDVLLVKFKPTATEGHKAVVRGLAGGAVKAYWLVPGLERLGTRQDLDFLAGVVRAVPGVEYAEPDYIVQRCVNPNDTYFGLQWGMHSTGQTVNGDPGIADADIDAPEAWNVFTGSSGFVVAVIDDGTNYGHADLAANMWTNPGEVAGNGLDDDANGYVDDVRGWDFYTNDNDPYGGGHGTHTAGTVGAVGNNALGVAGVSWQCKVMPLRFLGPMGGATSDAIEALQYAVGKGVKVSNNSWGGGGYSQALYDAINAARAAGHLFVAAAGNGGSDQVGDNNDAVAFYPASYTLDNVISVAATNNNDGRAGFSNYGATSVDLGAPGVNIVSTYGTGYAYSDGTSMACPHVAGAAALVWANNPSFSYAQVRARLLSTVRPVASLGGITVTGGVLNLAGAVGTSTNTAPSVTITAPVGGAAFTLGSTIDFAGSAGDTQDGSLTAALAWSSSLQGPLGAGGSFARGDLVAGTHVITAGVTDSGGLSGSASVTITVTDPAAPTPPAAPSNIAASRQSRGVALVTWADNSSNETSFQIERRRQHNNGSWISPTLIGPLAADSTSYLDSPGRNTFRYRVRAVNAAGPSAWTAWAVVNLR
ncbi:MAG TPA: S8 family serine peptidase [Phycisphaerales bacterium]|nr:S8 family serine peptidase [Phycisphaerales bacterium]